MNSLSDEIDAAESEWAQTAPSMPEDVPETKLAVKADKVFEEQIMPIAAIEKRRRELGVVDASLATREQAASLKTVNGLCRKVNGQVEKVRKFLVEEAVRVQRVVNARAKEIKEEVARIQKPILDRFADWEREDEEREQDLIQAERDAEEAERKAAQAAEDAKRQAEIDEQKRLNAELNERLAKERAEQAERQRLADEALQNQRSEMEKIERELAEYRAKQAAEDEAKRQADLAKAEAFQKAQAAERERLRLEAIEPDIPKIRRFAASINNLLAPPLFVLESDDAKATVHRAISDLKTIVSYLLTFGTK